MLRLFPTMILLLFASAAHAQQANSAFAKPNYLNAHFCIGQVQVFADLVGPTSHKTKAKEARALLQKLTSQANQLETRYKLKGSGEGEAQQKGGRIMAGLLPASGQWAKGGDIPIEAVRHYQQCASMVGM